MCLSGILLMFIMCREEVGIAMLLTYDAAVDDQQEGSVSRLKL